MVLCWFLLIPSWCWHAILCLLLTAVINSPCVHAITHMFCAVDSLFAHPAFVIRHDLHHHLVFLACCEASFGVVFLHELCYIVLLSGVFFDFWQYSSFCVDWYYH